MRAIWKGSITFSLVNIPISLYPATRREELKFRLLRKSDLSPIRYQRMAETDGKEVSWEEIVKGYEYEKGHFVVLDEEDFRRADVKATQTVDIMEFVALEEIDPVYFDQPYYLEPQKAGAKAYALLREALNKTGKVGIAKVVIKTRQHLAAIKPEERALVLELMHFSDELVEPSSLQIPGNLELRARDAAPCRLTCGYVTAGVTWSCPRLGRSLRICSATTPACHGEPEGLARAPARSGWSVVDRW